MSDLPSVWPGKIQTEEQQFKAAVSEYTGQRLGQAINYFKDKTDSLQTDVDAIEATLAAGIGKVKVSDLIVSASITATTQLYTTPTGKQIYAVIIQHLEFGGGVVFQKPVLFAGDDFDAPLAQATAGHASGIPIMQTKDFRYTKDRLGAGVTPFVLAISGTTKENFAIDYSGAAKTLDARFLILYEA